MDTNFPGAVQMATPPQLARYLLYTLELPDTLCRWEMQEEVAEVPGN